MYERAVKGNKANPRGEYNATERFGNVTIKENDQERITLKKDAMRKYRAENKNISKNVGARQYKGPDETMHVMSDAITVNSDPGGMRNKFDIVTYRGGKTGPYITMALTDRPMEG